MDVINATDRDFNIVYYLIYPNVRKLILKQATRPIKPTDFETQTEKAKNATIIVIAGREPDSAVM
jgi:hypothetical protein